MAADAPGAVDPAPFPGNMREGARGPAVVAMQGGLHAWSAFRLKAHPKEADLRHDLPTGDWLKPTTRQVGHFQALHGIPVTNTFGPHVHDALARWYTDADRAILVELHHHAQVAAFRAELAQVMDMTAGERDSWIYTQDSLRMQLEDPPPWHDPSTAEAIHADCSSSSCCILKYLLRKYGWTVLADALGDWPTTYTSISVGTPVAEANLLIGDRVHFGANSHMTIYRGKRPGQGNTLWVWSFGEEPGPEWRQLTYRPVYACRRDVS